MTESTQPRAYVRNIGTAVFWCFRFDNKITYINRDSVCNMDRELNGDTWRITLVNDDYYRFDNPAHVEFLDKKLKVTE